MISIVMAAFNVESVIGQALDSILSQNYSAWEIIIVADGCTDGTVPVVENYIRHHGIESRVILEVEEENHGYGYALRKGISLCAGDLCAIVDADDALCDNEALSKMASAHEQFPSASLCFSDYWECGPKLERTGKRCGPGVSTVIPAGKTYLGDFDSQGNYLGTPFHISHFKCWKTELYELTEGVDASLVKAVDTDLILKLFDVGEFVKVPGVFYLHRNHDDSITQRFKTQSPEYRAKVMEQKAEMYERARQRRKK